MTGKLPSVRQAMLDYFDRDQRRIEHALAVAANAERLLKYIDADETITMAAAYLHDIGIHEAERKHGSNSGKYQEVEGPPVARTILGQLSFSADFIEIVCEIVGKHHTPQGVDSPEFRILWDSDALVNLEEVLPGKNAEQIETILDRSFVSEAGYRIAQRKFLPREETA